MVRSDTFRSNGVRRAVSCTEPASEQIPLVLQAADELIFSDGTRAGWDDTVSTTASRLVVHRKGRQVRIRWSDPVSITLTQTDRIFFADQSRRQNILTVPHGGQIAVEVTVH